MKDVSSKIQTVRLVVQDKDCQNQIYDVVGLFICGRVDKLATETVLA